MTASRNHAHNASSVQTVGGRGASPARNAASGGLQMHAELLSFSEQATGKRRVASPWTEARDLLLACDYPRGVPLAEIFKRLSALPGVPLSSKKSITTHARQVLGLYRPEPAPKPQSAPVIQGSESHALFDIVTAAEALRWGAKHGLDPNVLDIGAVNRKRIQAGERQWIIGAPGVVERLAGN